MVKKDLDRLSLKDTYSMMMFVLYKMRDIPQMAPLSQLVYILDEQSLLKVMKYFGGKTVTFPTVDEFKRLVEVLLIYDGVDMKGGKLSEHLPNGDEDKTAVIELYSKVKEIMNEYEFVQ